MRVLKSTEIFVVMEHLPWLDFPRIVEGFENQVDAENAARLLNSKSLDSTFSSSKLGYVFEMEPMVKEERIVKIVNSIFRY